jgi:hypothetical protein
MAATAGFELLADAHAADVLDAVGINEPAPLDVADFLHVNGPRGDVDRAARVVAVVGRGDSSACCNATKRAESKGATARTLAN